MVTRRRLLLSGIALLAASRLGAQPRSFRVAYLSSNPPSDTSAADAAFRGRLRELGYVEGRNLMIDARYAEGDFSRLPRLAAELAGIKPDVLFAYGTPAALAAKEATRTVPIVFGGVNDPLSVGLVANMRSPGGNVTGVMTNNTELSGKRVSLLKEAVPGVVRVAALANPGFKPTSGMLAQIAEVASPLGLRLQILEARTADEIAVAFDRLPALKPDALLVLPDPWFLSQRSRIVELTLSHRIPAMFHLRQYVETGGLIAYGPTYIESFQQGAVLVDKILRGAKPPQLPVEQPWRYEVAINLKTARTLGITIPQSVLPRADLVIS